MFPLAISGGLILGTAMSILIKKKFSSTNLSLKGISKVWLSCTLASMLAITIALKLIGGIIILTWGIIKIVSIGLVAYGLYHCWKKLFKRNI